MAERERAREEILLEAEQAVLGVFAEWRRRHLRGLSNAQIESFTRGVNQSLLLVGLPPRGNSLPDFMTAEKVRSELCAYISDLNWTLDNIYTMARRALKRTPDDEKWGHVLRLCERQGCQPKVILRDNGGSLSTIEEDSNG